MTSWLCEYKALVNAYKCEIAEKSHFLVVNGYKKWCIVKGSQKNNLYFLNADILIGLRCESSKYDSIPTLSQCNLSLRLSTLNKYNLLFGDP